MYGCNMVRLAVEEYLSAVKEDFDLTRSPKRLAQLYAIQYILMQRGIGVRYVAGRFYVDNSISKQDESVLHWRLQNAGF